MSIKLNFDRSKLFLSGFGRCSLIHARSIASCLEDYSEPAETWAVNFLDYVSDGDKIFHMICPFSANLLAVLDEEEPQVITADNFAEGKVRMVRIIRPPKSKVKFMSQIAKEMQPGSLPVKHASFDRVVSPTCKKFNHPVPPIKRKSHDVSVRKSINDRLREIINSKSLRHGSSKRHKNDDSGTVKGIPRFEADRSVFGISNSNIARNEPNELKRGKLRDYIVEQLSHDTTREAIAREYTKPVCAILSSQLGSRELQIKLSSAFLKKLEKERRSKFRPQFFNLPNITRQKADQMPQKTYTRLAKTSFFLTKPKDLSGTQERYSRRGMHLVNFVR